ncbi:hypothetical protein [Roseinatronobacter sp. S2]|uniref:hypothetical protein n=1 Tax=Roseinatronobacter sp. S2 TaxID=3035471 RepID=UPI00240FE3C2|nr:hypothetical protein [Roseinatronobacter sp. S2]WFE77242.1 hypothetical protein P8S53_20530 [Roseinatronobacter sp. S2]
MTLRLQKRLAIGGAVVAVGLLFGYKVYMVTMAVSSQSACIAVESPSATPARRAC